MQRFLSSPPGPITALGLVGFLCVPLLARPDDGTSRCLLPTVDELMLLGGDVVETQANVFTSSAQSHGTVTALADGGFIVAWDSRRQEHGSYAVVAQRFDAWGQPVGGEVPVNATVVGMQMLPAVASDAESVWFAWQSHGQDGSGAAVVARQFDHAMNPIGDEIVVNTTTQGHQSQAAIAINDDGQAGVVWIDSSDPDQHRVMLRVLGCDESTNESEVAISAPDGGRDSVPSIVSDGQGGFLVSWSRTNAQGDPDSVIVQRVQRDGTLSQDAIVLNDADGRDHIEPGLCVLEDGGFAAVWHASTTEGFAITARFFDAEGEPLSEAMTIADASDGWKSGASILNRGDGRCIVVYNSEGEGGDGEGGGVMARAISADGTINSKPTPMNVHRTGRQEMHMATGAVRAVTDAQGRLAIVWDGASAHGDESSVNLTVHHPATLAREEATEPEERLAYLTGDSMPIPPYWDPNHVALRPLEGAASDGPDFGFEGVPSTGWTPPDPELAVGPDRIVAITNGQIALFDKSGNNLFRDEIENSFGFWGGLGADNFVFDPEAVWDPHDNRFFAMACERSDDNRSYFLLAVSKTASPNTTSDWWKYRIDVTSISDNDIDSPNMAVDADNVLLTADFFGPDKYLLYFIDKDSILEGGAVSAVHELIVGASQQSMGIPVQHDADAPAQYILQSTENSSNNTVIFHAVTDAFGSYNRQTFTLSVPTYTYPNQPPQRGSSSRPFLFEPRFWSCVQRNGSLWAVHHVNSSRARVRWYEFDMRGWPDGDTPIIKQTGELDYGDQIHTYFPSIGVDAENNAAITFARSSPDEYISMSRAVRKSTDAPNTFQPPMFVKESTIGYNGGRWGDYSATVDDPAAVGSFWGHHEFTLDGQWRTWIARYDVGDPPLILVSSNLVAGVRASLDVTGATANAQVAFLYSIRGLGSTYIPQLDVTVDLDGPVLAGARVADANGTARLLKRVPQGTQGRTIWLQAAEQGRASNVVQKVVQ